jgi:hypothetical protein
MIGWLASLLVTSLVAPRQAVTQVLALRLSNADVMVLVAIAAIVLTMTIWVMGAVANVPNDPFQEFVKSQPLLVALIQLFGIPFGAAITLGLARLFGGTGSFRDTVVVSVWINLVFALVQAALLLLVPILAPVAALLVLAAFVWFIIAYAAAITEVHGFTSIYKVMATMVVLFVGLIMLMNYLAVSAGLTPGGPI